MPGLRLGCAIGEPAIIRRMKELLPPWSVNTLAQAVGVEALNDKSYAEHTRQYVRKQRETLTHELRTFDGLTVYAGEANFVLVRIDSGKVKAQQLAGELLKKALPSVFVKILTDLTVGSFALPSEPGMKTRRTL